MVEQRKPYARRLAVLRVLSWPYRYPPLSWLVKPLEAWSATLVSDARERVARHLYISGSAIECEAARRWDDGRVPAPRMDDYRRAAARILAIITDQEN